MKDIKLERLEMRNFQRIKEFVFEPKGNDAEIRGDNATGKTTIKNAFTWVLFNKNSKGATKFGFKPKDKDGNIIHGLETSVELTLNVNGTIRTFKRAVIEKASKVRGTNITKYKDTSEWLVDGVPKKKSEYEQAISELIDEDIFKMITDPLYFNTQLKWEERRNILMDIAGEISDDEIIDSSEELKPLKEMLNGRTVADFKEITKHQIKPVSDSLDKIPVQIDEAERAIPSEDDIEFDEGQRQFVISMIEENENQLADIVHGVEITKQKNILNDNIKLKRTLENNLAADPSLIEEFKEEFARKRQVQDNISTLEREISVLERDISKVNRDIELNKIERQKLSKEWDDIFNQEFTGNICPTCKRELPDDEVEAHKREFNIKKANDLDVIESKLEIFKNAHNSLSEEITNHEREIEFRKDKLQEMKAELDEVVKSLSSKHEDYKKRIGNEISKTDEIINKTTDTIKEIESNSSSIVDSLQVEIASLKDEKNSYDVKLANKALMEKQKARIQELREDEKRLSVEYEELQKRMYLVEEFIRTKAEMLTERINANFTLAKFKLFEIQKNEGIQETCEVTYEGVPFLDMNDAAKINVGLDIINTLCKKYDVQSVIFIDNAESVTQIFDTYSQQIILVVDKEYKKITVTK